MSKCVAMIKPIKIGQLTPGFANRLGRVAHRKRIPRWANPSELATNVGAAHWFRAWDLEHTKRGACSGCDLCGGRGVAIPTGPIFFKDTDRNPAETSFPRLKTA